MTVALTLCVHEVYAKRFVEAGCSKLIYRSPDGVGLIPILEGMNYNGMSVAFRYEMPIGKVSDTPFAMQTGVKYDFLNGVDKDASAKHKEHYVSQSVCTLHLLHM